MNNRLLKSVSVLTVGLVLAPVFAMTASADGGDYDSNGYVSFEAGGTVIPVDPLSPTDLITPTNPDGTTPATGTAGPLSIDFASSLSFGKQAISSLDVTYYANAQYISGDKDGTTVDETRPNYVQVTDNRGSGSGWTLTVAESNQFVTGDGNVLTGAELTFWKGKTLGTTSFTPSYVATNKEVISTADTKIIAAAAGEGMGTWAYRLGDNSDYQENGGAHLILDAVSTASPITLKVVAGTNLAKVYTTTLNWKLSDTPEN